MHIRSTAHQFHLPTLALVASTLLTPAQASAQSVGLGTATNPAAVMTAERSQIPASQGKTQLVGTQSERLKRLEDLLSEENYGAAGTEGLAWIQSGDEPPDSALRLKIANSLAWSNRLSAAIKEYEKLVRNSDQFQNARIPLANTYRWSGRADLSVPLYEQALEDNEANQDALDGIEYAERDLRPRTTIEWTRDQDSDNLRLNTGTLTHRWRDTTLQQIYEVQTDLRTAQQNPNDPLTRHTGAAMRYTHTGLPLQPEVSISTQGSPTSRWFAGLRVKLGELPIHAEIARENFGMTAANAKALEAGLTAKRIGLTGSWSGAMGVLSSRLNAYEISDGNTMLTTNIKLTPNWQPLGVVVKPYASIDTRDLSFNTPNYWSPVEGSGSFGLGASAEWAEKDWYFVLAGQLGTRIYGDAGNSWNASIGAQRWLTRNTALTANLWGMASIRDGGRYRAHSLSLKLDRLW